MAKEQVACDGQEQWLGSITQGWEAPGRNLGLYSKCSGKPQQGFKKGSDLCLFLKLLFRLMSKEEMGKEGTEAQKASEEATTAGQGREQCLGLCYCDSFCVMLGTRNTVWDLSLLVCLFAGRFASDFWCPHLYIGENNYNIGSL